MEPRPCSPDAAVARALGLAAACAAGQHADASYQLGTGSYHATGPDVPWTTSSSGKLGSDCAGFAVCWSYRLPRHRPGFNRWQPKPGEPGPTVVDDINVDSAIEDADHQRELFAPVADAPRPGDLLVYPTIAKVGGAGPWIGHVSIVVDVPAAWTPGRWDTLRVAQCHGPDGFAPAVVLTDGSIWLHHDATWPTHRARLIRPAQ